MASLDSMRTRSSALPAVSDGEKTEKWQRGQSIEAIQQAVAAPTGGRGLVAEACQFLFVLRTLWTLQGVAFHPIQISRDAAVVAEGLMHNSRKRKNASAMGRRGNLRASRLRLPNERDRFGEALRPIETVTCARLSFHAWMGTWPVVPRRQQQGERSSRLFET